MYLLASCLNSESKSVEVSFDLYAFYWETTPVRKNSPVNITGEFLIHLPPEQCHFPGGTHLPESAGRRQPPGTGILRIDFGDYADRP